MKKVKEIKHNPHGKSFFIPEEETFTKDIVPVTEEFENRLTDDEKAIAWFINEHEKQLLNDERNFPQSQDHYNIFK